MPAARAKRSLLPRLLFHPMYPRFLLAAFLAYAVAWGFNPPDRKDWMLENALTLACVLVLVLTYRRFPLSNVSYTLIFVYLCLHTIGAHYTYSRVPWAEWINAVTFDAFGFSSKDASGRNHYDRFVHFNYGLLLAYPARELFCRVARARGFWGYYLPIDLTMSFSMLYELIEWGVAAHFGGDLGAAYLGTQGDEWDAHKDMALASLGGLIAMTVVAFINWKFDRHFGDEWRRSLAVKGHAPLGEVRLREMLDDEPVR